MTDKLQIRSERFDLTIDENPDSEHEVMIEIDDGFYYERPSIGIFIKKNHAVKIINHLIKVFDVSRDEVNLWVIISPSVF